MQVSDATFSELYHDWLNNCPFCNIDQSEMVLEDSSAQGVNLTSTAIEAVNLHAKWLDQRYKNYHDKDKTCL